MSHAEKQIQNFTSKSREGLTMFRINRVWQFSICLKQFVLCWFKRFISFNFQSTQPSKDFINWLISSVFKYQSLHKVYNLVTHVLYINMSLHLVWLSILKWHVDHLVDKKQCSGPYNYQYQIRKIHCIIILFREKNWFSCTMYKLVGLWLVLYLMVPLHKVYTVPV